MVFENIKLATHAGATSKELPAPAMFAKRKAFRRAGKWMPRNLVELSRIKQEVVMGGPVFHNFWFPDCSVEEVQGEFRLLFASNAHLPVVLVQEPRVAEQNLLVQGPWSQQNCWTKPTS